MNTQAEIYANVRNRALEEITARLDTRDFYELCQQYRWQKLDVAKEFEAIKEYVRSGKLPWPSFEEPA